MLRVLNEFGNYSSNKDRFRFWKRSTTRERLIAQSISEEESSDKDEVGIRDDLFRLSQPDIPCTIILHSSPFKAGWNWLILLLVLYVAVFTPYAAAFHYNYMAATQVKVTKKVKDVLSEPFIITDIVVDVMFMMDMIVNFRTTYLHNGEIVTDPKKIAVNYLKTWFLIDLVSAIPFDFILERAGTSDTATVTGIFKTPRLLRLLRVARKMDQYSEYGATVLALLMASFILIAHWLACIFYAIACMERPTLEHPISWLDLLADKMRMPYVANDTRSGPDMRSRYITSLYFTFTLLSSVGFGNVSPATNSEKVFSILAMMVGSLLSACIFGNVSTIMLRLYQGTEAFLDKQNNVREFIKFNHVPEDLSKRLLHHTEEEWWQTGGVDLNQVMNCFTGGLQADVTLHLNQSLFSSYSVFQAASPGCLRALSRKLKQMQSVPGDLILNDGDKVEQLYFITQGTVEISKNGLVIAILSRNDVFGDNMKEAIKRPRDKCAKSVYDVRSISYTDITKINISELVFILQSYSEFCTTFLSKFVSIFVITSETKIPSKSESKDFMDERNERDSSSVKHEVSSQGRRSASLLLKAAGLSTIADEGEEEGEEEAAEANQNSGQHKHEKHSQGRTRQETLSETLFKISERGNFNVTGDIMVHSENCIYYVTMHGSPRIGFSELGGLGGLGERSAMELRRSSSARLPLPDEKSLGNCSPCSLTDAPGDYYRESDDTYSGTVSLCWDNTDIPDFSSTDQSKNVNTQDSTTTNGNLPKDRGKHVAEKRTLESNMRCTLPEFVNINVAQLNLAQNISDDEVRLINARLEKQLDILNRRMAKFSSDLDSMVEEILFYIKQEQ